MPEPSSAPPSASSEEDRGLVTDALGGDQRAYERLVGKYQEPLRRHVGKMVRDQQQVDDLVQEAFVKAFGNITSYNPDYAFSTWLYRITTNHTELDLPLGTVKAHIFRARALLNKALRDRRHELE